MKYLKLEIGKSGIPGELSSDGVCNQHLLHKVSLSKLLGVELYARLQGEELLPTLQEMFELLGECGNGKAALEAFIVVHALMLPTQAKYPAYFSITQAEFDKRCRNEQKAFLEWLIPVFWKLRLYSLYRDHSHPGHSFLKYGNPLKELKEHIAIEVAFIWGGENDAVGIKAFKFLCDCVDTDKFFKRAKNLERDKIFSAKLDHEKLVIEPDDLNAVIQTMRKELPSRLPEILPWLKIAGESAPWEIRKFLGHAYVNAGGTISPE